MAMVRMGLSGLGHDNIVFNLCCHAIFDCVTVKINLLSGGRRDKGYVVFRIGDYRQRVGVNGYAS